MVLHTIVCLFAQKHFAEPEILKAESIVDIALQRAKLSPTQVSFKYLENGETVSQSLTFTQLVVRAKSIGAYLQQHNVQHRCILMLYPLEHLDFIEGLLYIRKNNF